jgi:hypothetical protein
MESNNNQASGNFPLQEPILCLPPTGVTATCFTIERPWTCQSQAFWRTLACVNDTMHPQGRVPSCAISPHARKRWEKPCRSPQILHVLCSLPWSPWQLGVPGSSLSPSVPHPLLASLAHYLSTMPSSTLSAPYQAWALNPAGDSWRQALQKGPHSNNRMGRGG